ncbi:MAG: imidazole glycerol phosphate synthase subunit HisH [Chloroflexi bacterium]|nr:imidazole glycerol phosphate synthase subunit HisH [Chloroflexota bacterium]
MIAVVDYGAGNLRSVVRAVRHVGFWPTVTADRAVVRHAAAVILPGVGAAGQMMAALRRLDLVDVLRGAAADGTPFLGVCLGLQVLLEWSEEDGGQPCLGILPGVVRRFPTALKVPHIGWNQVEICRADERLAGLPNGASFYFVHSYYPEIADGRDALGHTEYGAIRFPSILARGNLLATQFHPEKSGDLGLRLYENFCALALRCEASR